MNGPLLYLLDLAGTAVFAVSGVVLAARARMDLFGMLVLALVTAIGGGTIRDMMLDRGPVFWVRDPNYLFVVLVTCALALVPIQRSRKIPRWALPVLDAVGLAVFVGIGVNKTLAVTSAPLVAMTMGVLTGVGGGIVRDVLARRVPLILRAELYAKAGFAGGALHVAACRLGMPVDAATLSGMAITLAVRLAALRWHWKLPKLRDRQTGFD